MDDAEKAARIAELEHDHVGRAVEYVRLSNELHEKHLKLIAIEIQIAKLKQELADK